MGTKTMKETSQEKLPPSDMLIYQAMEEMRTTGKVEVICPKCKKHPSVRSNVGGNRNLVICECRYLFWGEICF